MPLCLLAPPDLTDMGVEQAQYLNSILDGGGWFKTMSGGAKARAIVSPMTRCLNVSESSFPLI